MTTDTPAELNDIVDAALRAAVRAPSPHNTQPWEFKTGNDRIDVLLDETRVLRVADADAREAHLACGAALLNMRLAVASMGRVCRAEAVRDQARPRLLGTVHIGGPHRPSPEDQRLAAAVERRHTNRKPFLDRRVPVHVRHSLTSAAETEGARLVLLTTAQLGAFTTLLRRADRILTANQDYQAELLAWTHAGDRNDGVPRSAGGPMALNTGLLALRDYGGREDKAMREFERDPLVAVLTSPGDTRMAQVRAGMAMQRVLLAATASGLSASFLSQPIEVGSVRAELRALVGGRSVPQTAFRLGYGFPGAVTARRAPGTVVH